jgi:hypothetical protein
LLKLTQDDVYPWSLRTFFNIKEVGNPPELDKEKQMYNILEMLGLPVYNLMHSGSKISVQPGVRRESEILCVVRRECR